MVAAFFDGCGTVTLRHMKVSDHSEKLQDDSVVLLCQHYVFQRFRGKTIRFYCFDIFLAL